MVLESSSNATRKLAAEQIGKIQQTHPHYLQNLLERSHKYLVSEDWDTRCGASGAIAAIVRHLPVFEFLGDGDERGVHSSLLHVQGDGSIQMVKNEEMVNEKEGEKMMASIGCELHQNTIGINEDDDARLSYSTFNFGTLIESGKRLLGSSGEEYDVDIRALSPEELREQRSIINDILGDEIAASYFTDDDLKVRREELEKNRAIQEVEVASKNVSSRMKNVLKRRKKTGESEVSVEDSKVKVKVQITDQSNSDKVVMESVIDVDRAFEDAKEWPLERFCNELCNELFDHRWYIRHGAAMGLLEIISKQAIMAGKRADQSPSMQIKSNHLWLEDFSIRLLCVLILDRFQDYSFSVPVSPVRETCGMVLGATINTIPHNLLAPMFNVVLSMCNEDNSWQVRHSGYLVLRYLITLRKDFMSTNMSIFFNQILIGLQDEETEVQGVASTAILPLINTPLLLDFDLNKLSAQLWNNLHNLDDLSSSTVSIMELISAMVSSTITTNPHDPSPPPGNLENPSEQIQQSQNLHGNLENPSGEQEPELTVYDYQVAESARQKLLMNYIGHGLLTAVYPVFQSDPHVKIPCLFPFFRSNSKEIRLAVLSTIKSLIVANIGTRDQWMPSIAYRLFFLVFQNFVLETQPDIVEKTRDLWKLILLSYPSSYTETNKCEYECVLSSEFTAQWYEYFCIQNGQKIPRSKILSFDSNGDVDEVEDVAGRSLADNAMHIAIAEAISDILYLVPEVVPAQLPFIYSLLNSSSAAEIKCATLIIRFWAERYGSASEVRLYLSSGLVDDVVLLNESEVPTQLSELQGQLNEINLYLKDYLHLLAQVGIEFQLGVDIEGLTLDQSKLLLDQLQLVLDKIPNKSLKKKIEMQNHIVDGSIKLALTHQQQLVMYVSSTISAAVVFCGAFPSKLVKIINPLMKSTRFELDMKMQRLSCEALATLVFRTYESHPIPCQRILDHLASLLQSDFYHLPTLRMVGSLYELLQDAGISRGTTKSSSGGEEKERDGPASKRSKFRNVNGKNTDGPLGSDTGIKFDIVKPESPEENPLVGNQFRGGETTLKMIVQLFGSRLFSSLPGLWEMIDAPISKMNLSDTQEELVKKSFLLASVLVNGHDGSSLNEQFLSIIPKTIPYLNDASMTVQALSAHAIASIIRASAPKSILSMVTHIVPALNDISHVQSRRGAALVLHCIIEELALDVLPYLIFLMTAALGRMSDQDILVRKIISHSFAKLVQLMPLERDAPDPPGMPEYLTEQRRVERGFLEQLLGGKKLDHYPLSIAINTELRGYQQDGVNWLAFLNKYNLHGILADDMGLGKTLQTLCIIFSDSENRAKKFKETRSPEFQKLPCIVVCPSILVAHWSREIEKFCPDKFSVIQYGGDQSERAALVKRISSADIVIVSYEKLRSDIERFENVQFNYCVLDEGHLIKNPTSKISQSVKKLRSSHRLLLSGTPIQNNLLELWSLFDFLMPGFLGTEEQFKTSYSKPVMASKDPKSTVEQQNAGMMALEALHRQVLPFILRRMKADVLADLPPKIIQDVTVELSSIQAKLYEDFSKSNAIHVDRENVHVFQALHYLRGLCSHPKLVLNEKNPLYAEIMTDLENQGRKLDDIEVGAKLVALREVLLSSGVGLESSGDIGGVSQNRILVFTQLKSMLDIIENDLFKRHMPTVSYLRLDGNVPAGQRMKIVETFNSNPSIDVLLLTVSVGGLGLNLTGANVVIFVEHDWNPQNDIQAMDRVHRIGQTKTVNVYRLITKETIEEKIMGLQRFKLSMADSVVNRDNQSFKDMDTSQLFNLFPNDKHDKNLHPTTMNTTGMDEFGNITAGSKGKKNQNSQIQEILEKLDQIAQATRYSEEYNMETFLSKIK